MQAKVGKGRGKDGGGEGRGWVEEGDGWGGGWVEEGDGWGGGGGWVMGRENWITPPD